MTVRDRLHHDPPGSPSASMTTFAIYLSVSAACYALRLAVGGFVREMRRNRRLRAERFARRCGSRQ
jgi:hypothetical protein